MSLQTWMLLVHDKKKYEKKYYIKLHVLSQFNQNIYHTETFKTLSSEI